MIKRTILISSLFLTFQSSAENISREEINKSINYNNYFDFCLTLREMAGNTAVVFYQGNIEGTQYLLKKYEGEYIYNYFKSLIASAKKLPELENEEDQKILIDKFKNNALVVCMKDYEHKQEENDLITLTDIPLK